FLIAPSIAFGSCTSDSIANVRSALGSILEQTYFTGSRCRLTNTTAAPPLKSLSAIASPLPVPAPVTNATFPVKSILDSPINFWHNASNSGEKTRQGFYVHCLPWLWPQHS